MARRTNPAETLEQMPGEEMPGETLYRVMEGYVSGHRQDYRPGHIVTAQDLVGDVRVYLELGVIAPLAAEPSLVEQGD